MPKNPNQTDQLEYLLSTRDFWGQYRTQKENAAWAAIALYLGGLLGFASLIFNDKYQWSYLSLLMICPAVIILFLTLLFVLRQYEDRIFASKRIHFCNVELELLVKVRTELKEKFLMDYDKDHISWNLFAPVLAAIICTLLFVFAVLFMVWLHS